MNTNFNRNWFQLYIENILWCTDLDKWRSYIQNLKDFTINYSTQSTIKGILQKDSTDFFYSWTLSLFEWIHWLQNYRYSWAVVKLYYSLYYFTRSFLAINNIWIIRNKSLFYIKNSYWEIPKQNTDKDWNTTHKWIIKIFLNEFWKTDYYSSNRIEDMNSYEWMLDLREHINYRVSSFYEPDLYYIFKDIDKYISENELNILLEKYLDIKEKGLYIFSPEHAFLAIPLNKFSNLLDIYKSKWITNILSEEKYLFLSKYITWCDILIKLLGSIK